jgi:hypothetical protein
VLQATLPAGDIASHSTRKRKAASGAANASILLPLDDELLNDPLGFLEPVDVGLSLTDDKHSSSKAAYAEHHVQFMQLDFNHCLDSQLDDMDQVCSAHLAGSKSELL